MTKLEYNEQYPRLHSSTFVWQELEPAIGVIVAQIRALFGLPPTFMEDTKTRTYGVPAGVTGIADWWAS